MKNKLLTLLICFLFNTTFAQITGYKYYVKLDTVKSLGVYNIALDPKITDHLKFDFSDVRVVNSALHSIPFYLNNLSKQKDTSLYRYKLPYLTIYLEAGDKYWLILDNKNAMYPVYNFKPVDSAFAKYPFLNTGEVTVIKNYMIKPVATANYTWVLWAVLLLVLIVLGFFSRKMIKEINLKKDNDPL